MNIIYIKQHWNEKNDGEISLQLKSDDGKGQFLIETKGLPIVPIVECEDENVEIRFVNRNKQGFIYECVVKDFGKKKKYDINIKYTIVYMDR